MRKFISILLIFIASGMNLHARGGQDISPSRMTFGLEWGYVGTLLVGHHDNFHAPEGYRVDRLGTSFDYSNNADMYIHLGYNLSHTLNLSVYIGYEGISDFHKAIPISLRLKKYFNENPAADRWFSFIDIGSGFSIEKPVREIFTGKIGGGYSLALCRSCSLDFNLSARGIYTHHKIVYDGVEIPQDEINRNNAYTLAFSLGLALNF